jgi:hypothetical protein
MIISTITILVRQSTNSVTDQPPNEHISEHNSPNEGAGALAASPLPAVDPNNPPPLVAGVAAADVVEAAAEPPKLKPPVDGAAVLEASVVAAGVPPKLKPPVDGVAVFAASVVAAEVPNEKPPPDGSGALVEGAPKLNPIVLIYTATISDVTVWFGSFDIWLVIHSDYSLSGVQTALRKETTI